MEEAASWFYLGAFVASNRGRASRTQAQNNSTPLTDAHIAFHSSVHAIELTGPQLHQPLL